MTGFTQIREEPEIEGTKFQRKTLRLALYQRIGGRSKQRMLRVFLFSFVSLLPFFVSSW
jgi:hypothetical protein